MIKYSKYLLSYVFSKKPIYFILLILFCVFNTLVLIQINRENRQGLMFINAFSTFNQFVPFVFMAIFACLIVIYVFKEQQDDGSDLLILSKSISRIKMVLSKFLVTYFFLVLYAFVTFTNFTLIASFDSIAIKNDSLLPLKFSGSLALGCLIISFLLANILLLFSTFFKKTTILIFASSFVPIIPIFSFIMARTGGGLPPSSLNFIDKRSYLISSKRATLEHIPQEPNDIWFFLNDNDKKIYHLITDKKIKENFENYKKNFWYQHFSYFDIWYQWSRFLDLFLKDDRISRSNIKNFITKNLKFTKSNQNVPIKIGKEEYLFLINDLEMLKLKEILQFLEENPNQKNQDNLKNYFNWLKNYLLKKNDLTFSQLACALEHILYIFDPKQNQYVWPAQLKKVTSDDQVWQKLTSKAPSSSGILLANILFENNNLEQDNPFFKQMFANLQINQVNSLLPQDASNEYEKKVKNYLVKNNNYIKVLAQNDFLSTEAILIFWGTIFFIIFAVTFYVYFKKDFK